MGLQPFRIVGMNFSGKAPLPPFIETDAKVIEPNSVHMELLAVGTENRDKLRREVQHLPELHFISAQFLLCSFTLSDVDHRAHKFNEMAGRAQNRTTYDVNVPDGAIRMHDAVVRLKRHLLAGSRLDYFPAAGLVARMNPLKEFFEPGQTVLWIETQNTVAFL